MKIGSFEVSAASNDDKWKSALVVASVGDRKYIGLLDEGGMPPTPPEFRSTRKNNFVLSGVLRLVEDSIPQLGQQGVVGWLPLGAMLPLHGGYVQRMEVWVDALYYVADLNTAAAKVLTDSYLKAIDPPMVQLVEGSASKVKI